eukprot:796022-Pyramimonas_sp.AAC.1
MPAMTFAPTAANAARISPRCSVPSTGKDWDSTPTSHRVPLCVVERNGPDCVMTKDGETFTQTSDRNAAHSTTSAVSRKSSLSGLPISLDSTK